MEKDGKRKQTLSQMAVWRWFTMNIPYMDAMDDNKP